MLICTYSKSAISNPNDLLRQKMCDYLDQDRTLSNSLRATY